MKRIHHLASHLGPVVALVGLLAACGHGKTTGPPPSLGAAAEDGGLEGIAAPAPMSADAGGAASVPGERATAAEAAIETPAGDDAVASATQQRPGLGTVFGERHESRVVSTSFERGNPTTPDVVLSMRYDDARGVEQMGRYTGTTAWSSSRAATARDTFVVKLVDEHGDVLPAAWINNEPFAVGERERRYNVGIENNSPYRYEVVGSVDGLDVIDGEAAGYHKRGYVLDPYTSMMIEGWRTSDDTVAAFRFGAIADSYADRKGDGRNVGVIGVAFFHEEGAMPWAELQRRASADPFPRRYAQPPPR